MKPWHERMSDLAAAKIHRPGWHGWIFTKAAQGGVFVHGAVCPPLTKGPRKGQPNVRKADAATKCRVWLSVEECGS